MYIEFGYPPFCVFVTIVAAFLVMVMRAKIVSLFDRILTKKRGDV